MKDFMNDKLSKEELYEVFEKNRNKNQPIIYNIETTNACNMKCKMCPRTTMMTRKIETLKYDDFISIVDQLKPFTAEEWQTWKDFAYNTYGIAENEMSENHFFLYIIPKVIQLHGYGDPLLDKNIDKFVKYLNDKGFYSYFSCNPTNINIEKMTKLFDSGLDYIKYSIESVDDSTHKEIRGDLSNFTESYQNILKLLEIKKQNNYKTTIIITMLNLNNTLQKEEYDKLKEYFKDLDVYIYLKSEDQLWYRQDYHQTNSIHWSELCRHPWMSMTIKSNCEVAMCMEDFNNEIILGNTKNNSLVDIWNGELYNQFRNDQLNNNDIKCVNQCDMKILGYKDV
jgi:MoaA/NifB/PqqE/SkfB family radical SAM enzyme